MFVHCLVCGRWTAGLLELSEKWEGIKPATFLPVKTKRTGWKILKCSVEQTVTVIGSSLWATTSCLFIVPEKCNLKRKTKTIKTSSQSCSFSCIFSQFSHKIHRLVREFTDQMIQLEISEDNNGNQTLWVRLASRPEGEIIHLNLINIQKDAHLHLCRVYSLLIKNYTYRQF